MTCHHDPGFELDYAAQHALKEFEDCIQYNLSLTEEEKDILVSRLIRSFKELLPYRWQELIDVCNERNLSTQEQ